MLILDLPLLFAISTRRARILDKFQKFRFLSSQKERMKGRKNKKSFFVLSTYFPHVPDAGTFPFVTRLFGWKLAKSTRQISKLSFSEKRRKRKEKRRKENSLIFRATITPSVTPLPKENTIPARNYETSGRDEGDSRNRTGRDLGQGQASLLENVKNVCTRCRCRSIATRCFNSRPRYTDGAAHWQPSTPLKSRGGSGIVASFPLPTLSTSIRFWPRCSRTF